MYTMALLKQRTMYTETLLKHEDVNLYIRYCTVRRFLSGGIILGSPLSCPDLFLYTITLPAVSCDASPTLSYTTLELASRVLSSSKKSAKYVSAGFLVVV
jgi:hypothetical protein